MPNVKVRITTESEEQSSGNAAALSQQSATPDAKGMATTSLFVHAAVGNIKQAINYGLSNVGNFTGDYIKQNQINNQLEMFSNVSTIAMGAISGGWIGAVIATASIAMKVGLGEFGKYTQNQISSLNNRLSMERSGNQLFDGSRATED